MSENEYRISGRLDAETGELYEKLRDETGFVGQRKDTRFLKAVLSLLQELLQRGMIVANGGPLPTLALQANDDVPATSESAPETHTKKSSHVLPETAEHLLSVLNLRENEYAEVLQACERSYGSLDELLRVGLLNEARNSNLLAQKTTQFDFTDPTQRGRRRGAGYAYVESVIQQLMETNLHAKEPWEKVYITRGQVAKLTGTNRNDINTYFDNHRELLDEHHKSVGFTSVEAGESHNRLRGNRTRRKMQED
jgi:hypothetical protein